MNSEASTAARGDTGDLPERLRRGLPAAMKARDAVAVAALRSALSAIENAEAVDPAQAPPPGGAEIGVAGTVLGVRAADVERRALTGAQVEAIVLAEVTERDKVAREYDQHDRGDRAERLRGEANVLRAYLDGRDGAGIRDSG